MPNNPHTRLITLGKANDSEAQSLLHRAFRQVQPLLIKHNYIVPLISEFYPRQQNLLGLNIGSDGAGSTREIRLRLRLASDEMTFFSFEFILGTLLHEITHNVRGPHDVIFYKKLDELTAACEELMAKGIQGTGVGFDAPAAGKIGGTAVQGRSAIRAAAAQAAEARLRRQQVMPAGGRKVGGDLTMKNLYSAAEAAAAAAMRRERDNVWCPNERLEKETEKTHDIDAALNIILQNGSTEVVDLTKEPDRPPTNHGKHEDGREWTCRTCTLINRAATEHCDACMVDREYVLPS